jgi:hypothetical protein
VGNAFYLRGISSRITAFSDEVAVSFDPARVAELEDFWKKHRDTVGLTVGHRELDRICEAIISLRASCEMGDRSAALVYLSLLRNAAEEIAKHEELSASNLF